MQISDCAADYLIRISGR